MAQGHCQTRLLTGIVLFYLLSRANEAMLFHVLDETNPRGDLQPFSFSALVSLPRLRTTERRFSRGRYKQPY